MAINDGIHRFKDVLKKQIGVAFRIYLSIAILLSPLYLMNAANALTTVRDWGITNVTKQGASVVIDGAKSVVINGSTVTKTSTSLLTPTAKAVAKVLGKGIAYGALSVAVEQLLGAVDWVLDPANNRITYTKSAEPTDPNDPTVQLIWQLGANEGGGYIYASKEQAGRAMCTKKGGTYSGITWVSSGGDRANVGCSDQYGNVKQWDLMAIPNPAYNPNAVPDDKPKTIPLETVAQQVISNAESGNAAAQDATKAAAEDMLENDTATQRQVANQLDANAKTPTSEAGKAQSKTEEAEAENSASSPKASTETETDFQLPLFCEWAPTVCEAAQYVINQPKLWAENIKAAYDDAVDYFKEEPTDSEPEELEIEQPEFEADEVNLQGSTTCPQDQVSFSLMGNSYTLDMPYQPVCNALEFFRPAVLTVGAITSAFIVAGIRTKEDEE
ncbi:virulence factor TspB C-terminal domain-related protein [Acinetobacter ursingii]|uniref:virulence factor TspB C-terminal domain-related protein n=1 Tax=Acinetobacter ursingii TaxID=108980 RepID=UPI003AF65237